MIASAKSLPPTRSSLSRVAWARPAQRHFTPRAYRTRACSVTFGAPVTGRYAISVRGPQPARSRDVRSELSFKLNNASDERSRASDGFLRYRLPFVGAPTQQKRVGLESSQACGNVSVKSVVRHVMLSPFAGGSAQASPSHRRRVGLCRRQPKGKASNIARNAPVTFGAGVDGHYARKS
jgi:hypothetical protein